MSTTEIKTELQQMIERENDMSILEAIRTILQKTSLNPILKDKLAERALKSEKDIIEGRVLSKEQIQQAHRAEMKLFFTEQSLANLQEDHLQRAGRKHLHHRHF